MTAPVALSVRAPSVADALAAFMAKHAIDRHGYARRVFLVRLGPIPLPFPNPGFLALHDLHHVALDAAPDFWGEVEVSAFELRSGCPSALVALLCVGALSFAALLRPARVWRAWKKYAGARNLYRGALCASYDDALALGIDELRRLMLAGANEREEARC